MGRRLFWFSGTGLKKATTIYTKNSWMRFVGWFTIAVFAAYFADLSYFGGTYGRAVESILAQMAHSFR
jgi:hypothetical protein